MPQNPLPQPPFAPITKVDQDPPLTNEQLAKFVPNPGDGASLLLRSESGVPNRGGYYFHFKYEPPNYVIFTFAGERIHSLTLDDLRALINHCAGRSFSEHSFTVCQEHINLRDDPS